MDSLDLQLDGCNAGRRGLSELYEWVFNLVVLRGQRCLLLGIYEGHLSALPKSEIIDANDELFGYFK
jgi:hypothetical protein